MRNTARRSIILCGLAVLLALSGCALATAPGRTQPVIEPSACPDEDGEPAPGRSIVVAGEEVPIGAPGPGEALDDVIRAFHIT